MRGCANWCHETSLTISMVNWINAVCCCQCHFMTRTRWLSFLLPWQTFPWIVSVHSSQITLLAAFTSAPFCRRISTTSLHPSCADTYKGVRPSWGAQHGQQMQTHKRGWSANTCWTISIICPFFPFKKMQTQQRLCQHIPYLQACLRKDPYSIDITHWWTNVKKKCQSHGMCGKSNALDETFFAVKENSSAVCTQTQQQSFLFNPQNSSKNMHTSAPSLVQGISIRKCFNHKPILWGAHILTGPQEKHAKLCASLITFYPICIDVQTDAMNPHQPHPCPIGSTQSAIVNAIPTLWPSFLPPWHGFLSIMPLHSSQITLLAAFRSAPFWRRISTTSLCPRNADIYRGVAPFWGIQHGPQMRTHKRGWLAKKCWTIYIYCPFISQPRKCKHNIDSVKG